jgi:hypothetical protein
MKHEQAENLIADYAMGRLGEDECKAIERHIKNCAACRAMLAEARELRDVLRLERPERLLAHVQAAHLTRFALDRSSLEPRLSTWIEEHLSSCDACREAAEILRSESSDSPGPIRPSVRAPDVPSRGPWEWLSRTVLQPAPALAYLVMLVAVVGLWSVSDRTPTMAPSEPDALLLPPAISVYPAERFRSDGPTEVEPVSIPAPADGDLYLRIHSEIDEAVLENPAATLRFGISDGAEIVVAGPIVPGGITELGVLQLRIRAGLLEPGRTYRLEIGLDGDEPLFHRDLVLVP